MECIKCKGKMITAKLCGYGGKLCLTNKKKAILETLYQSIVSSYFGDGDV